MTRTATRPRLPAFAALALAAAALAALVASAPATAERLPDGESFHFAPGEELTLQPVDLREPLSSGANACAGGPCVRHTSEQWHAYTFTAAATVRPVRSHVWIDVTRPTLGADACVLEAFIQVVAPSGESKWYWSFCVGMDTLGLGASPGLHEVEFDWPAHYDTVDAVPGDTLYAAMWTASTSMPLSPSMYLVADADRPSHFVLSGAQESQAPHEGQAPSEPPEPPATTTSAPASTSSRPTSTTAPTSSGESPAPTTTLGPEPTDALTSDAPQPGKASPATPGAALALLAAGWSVRRRLE